MRKLWQDMEGKTQIVCRKRANGGKQWMQRKTYKAKKNKNKKGQYDIEHARVV
jgi:hypothetical protein